MAGRSRTLQVPYYAQPTGITCQSTTLKMFAGYLESNVVNQSTVGGAKEIQDIWKEVNEGSGRPSKLRNAHANMKWWLEKYFPTVHFTYETLTREDQALESIIKHIDAGYPVLVAVSHVNVAGHIILVVGYENYLPYQSSMDFKLIVNDPYGQFDPVLKSKLFGKRRFDGGSSLMSGGQSGPGKEVKLPVTAVNRHRPGDAQFGTWYLISADGRTAGY